MPKKPDTIQVQLRFPLNPEQDRLQDAYPVPGVKRYLAIYKHPLFLHSWFVVHRRNGRTLPAEFLTKEVAMLVALLFAQSVGEATLKVNDAETFWKRCHPLIRNAAKECAEKFND